ncbi:hypothetical protein [Rubrivirga sp. IMCC45206]|uniref:hypothetical protein n=1 Tax=Rubrivirga sp. IMCC45206 TaxID=3391614 RepID=UPI00398FF68C
MPRPGSPISRRDSLKRAAGALALGLGTPVAVLATEADGFQLAFYSRDEPEPFHTVPISESVAARLRDAEPAAVFKFERVQGSTTRTLGTAQLKV